MAGFDRVHRLLDRVADLPGIRGWRERRYERLFASNTGWNMYRGVFATREDAARSAPPTKPIGYDNADSAELYKDRVRRVLPSDYPAALWLDRMFRDGGTRVLDVGGNIGNSYFAYERLLEYPAGIRWTVHDVPAVNARGREFAREHDARGALTFEDRVEEAEPADVLLLNGSLQFLPVTLTGLVESLRARPPHILVNRTPLHPDSSFFTLQGIGTAFCPYHVHGRDDLLRETDRLGYRMVDQWRVPDLSCRIPFHPEHSFDGYEGFHLAQGGTED